MTRRRFESFKAQIFSTLYCKMPRRNHKRKAKVPEYIYDRLGSLLRQRNQLPLGTPVKTKVVLEELGPSATSSYKTHIGFRRKQYRYKLKKARTRDIHRLRLV
jgi:hypothetical protein